MCLRLVRDTKGEEGLVLHQPLHGFSNKYGKGPYYSYLKEPSERIKLETREAWSGTEAESVDLQRFIAFSRTLLKLFIKIPLESITMKVLQRNWRRMNF